MAKEKPKSKSIETTKSPDNKLTAKIQMQNKRTEATGKSKIIKIMDKKTIAPK